MKVKNDGYLERPDGKEGIEQEDVTVTVSSSEIVEIRKIRKSRSDATLNFRFGIVPDEF